MEGQPPVHTIMCAWLQIPAVMLVDAYLEPPKLDGAQIVLPAEMQLKVSHCDLRYRHHMARLRAALGCKATLACHGQRLLMSGRVMAGRSDGGRIGA